MTLVLFEVLPAVLGDVQEGVEPHQIGSIENGAFRPPGCRAKNRVHFFDAVATFRHDAHGFHHAKYADAIGHEVWRIFAVDNAFAQDLLAKGRDARTDGRVRLWPVHQFQEVHITDGVEKVGDQEAFRKRLAAPLEHVLNLQAGCIGRDDGIFTDQSFELLEKRLFGLEFFDDDLDDPIAFLHALEVIF